MSKKLGDGRRHLVDRVMSAGRESGTRSILFHQAVAQVLSLNASDTKCLDLIVLHGPASPGSLAALTGLTTGAVTVLIDRLARAGLVARRPSDRDRRRTVLTATPKAAKVLHPLYMPMVKRLRRLLSRHSDRDLRLLEKFFALTTDFWSEETERALSFRPRLPAKRRK